eukprot:IDg15415t1
MVRGLKEAMANFLGGGWGSVSDYRWVDYTIPFTEIHVFEKRQLIMPMGNMLTNRSQPCDIFHYRKPGELSPCVAQLAFTGKKVAPNSIRQIPVHHLSTWKVSMIRYMSQPGLPGLP